MDQDPGDYTALRTNTSLIIITGELPRRGCINIMIINDTLVEKVEYFSVQVISPRSGLPTNVRLDPDRTFVEILDNDCKSPVLNNLIRISIPHFNLSVSPFV